MERLVLELRMRVKEYILNNMSIITNSNNKLIAKNTVFLYARMIIMMVVSLYTSRVVLASLGAEDFGIYNIVAGVVVLFSFLNTAMVESIQRFLNYEMGRGDKEETKRVFSMGINCQVLIILMVLILGETVGLWFLNTHLNIPEERMNIANWIYQLSILTICIKIFYTPYNAAIIAYEKMSIYAYISILEAVLKLVIAYMLVISPCDKLLSYALLTCLLTVIITLLYIIYCKANFDICIYSYFKDMTLFKRMMSFSGWSIMGGVANLAYTQGLNIIMNMFFTVVANASMGIANQVNSAISSLVSNFSTAFKPQIIKYYAAENNEMFVILIQRTSKICYFLLFIIALPVLLYCDNLLNVWLTEVPDYAVSFCKLIIICTLIDSINTPIWTAINATGKIKKYNIVTTVLRLLILPISIIGFYQGLKPEFALMANIIINIIIQSWNLYHLHNLVGYSLKDHLKVAVAPCLLVTILSLLVSFFIKTVFLECAFNLIIHICFTVTIVGIFIFVLGLNKSERSSFVLFFLSKIKS